MLKANTQLGNVNGTNKPITGPQQSLRGYRGHLILLSYKNLGFTQEKLWVWEKSQEDFVEQDLVGPKMMCNKPEINKYHAAK